MRPLNRRDPAPSRLTYRAQRLWLRPSFRRLLRIGPPLALLVAAMVYFGGDAEFRGRVSEFYADMRTSIDRRDEFRVERLAVTGASYSVSRAVREAASLSLPASSLRLNVTDVRTRVEALPGVARASVRIAEAGTIHIDVVERRPAVLWRHDGTLKILDAKGVAIDTLTSREERPTLPLILGRAADQSVAEALEIVAISAPIYNRVRGLERVGSRRWDVILDRDQVVMLPETNPLRAFRRVMALHRENDLLERDVEAVDMRIAGRPVLRVGAGALGVLRQSRYGN